MSGNSSLGKQGEQIAVDYLRKNQYEILDRNYRTRAGEIDIVAQKAGRLIFCEVKARRDNRKGKPYEAMTSWKINHLRRAIHSYVKQKHWLKVLWHIDVISIEFNADDSLKKLQHFENLTW